MSRLADVHRILRNFVLLCQVLGVLAEIFFGIVLLKCFFAHLLAVHRLIEVGEALDVAGAFLLLSCAFGLPSGGLGPVLLAKDPLHCFL